MSELAEADKKIRKYYSEKKYPELVKYLEPLLKKYPDNHGLYFHLANGLLITGNYDKALENIQKAVAMESKRASYYGVMGDIYIKKKNKEKALEAYKKRLELDPEKIEEIFYNLSKYLPKDGELAILSELLVHVSDNLNKKKEFDKRDIEPLIYFAALHLNPKTLDTSLSYYLDAMVAKITYRKNNQELLEFLLNITTRYIKNIIELAPNYLPSLHTKLTKKKEVDLSFKDALVFVLLGYYYELKDIISEGHKALGQASKIVKKQRDVKLNELFAKIVMSYLHRHKKYLEDFMAKMNKSRKS